MAGCILAHQRPAQKNFKVSSRTLAHPPHSPWIQKDTAGKLFQLKAETIQLSTAGTEGYSWDTAR